MSAGRLIGFAFVGLLVVAAAAQWRADAGRSSPWTRLLATPPRRDSLQALEDELVERSMVVEALRPVAQHWRFEALNDGGGKVIRGGDGWLFYRPGVEAAAMRGEPSQAAAAIREYRDGLASRGIALLVVIAPNKESVYPEMLGVGGSGAWGETDRLFVELQASGIASVDLRKSFATARKAGGPALYLKEDSHWSPAGIKVAAEAIAGAARQFVSQGELRLASESESVQRHGDLLRLVGAPSLLGAGAREAITAERVLGASEAADSSVLLMGDSFLRIFQTDEPGNSGLPAHLGRELGQPLSTLVAEGGAATFVRQELFRRPSLLTGKRLVIWEFVERDLGLAADHWQRVPVPR